MKKKIFTLPFIIILILAANVFGQEKNTSEKSNDKYLKEVEVMAEPIGGISAIQKKVIYPEIAKRAGIEGKVYIQAFIDEKGDVVKTIMLKGIGSGCDEAAMKAVKETKFTPAKQRDKLVKLQVVVPVLFKLNKSKK
ncbi:MAG: energy transducer TonB [Ignavibacteriaceae bacterium]